VPADTGVDDGRAGFKQRHRGLGHPERRIHIGFVGLVELGGGEVENGLARKLARGIVDHDVETAKVARGVRHQAAAKRFVFEVARDQHGLAAGGADQVGYLARIGFLGRQVVDRHVGALARVGNGGSATDAGVATCDQRLAPLEAAAALVGSLTVVGARVHLAGEARPWLLLRLERRLLIGSARIEQRHVWRGCRRAFADLVRSRSCRGGNDGRAQQAGGEAADHGPARCVGVFRLHACLSVRTVK